MRRVLFLPTEEEIKRARLEVDADGTSGENGLPASMGRATGFAGAQAQPPAGGRELHAVSDNGGVPVVLDTNIVLDVFVFNDAAAAPLKQALETSEVDWLATPPMRDELARVLAYPQIVPRLTFYQRTAEDVLADFDRYAQLTEVAAKAAVTCSDADDQKFIDLAVAHQALLLSKDQHVLSMRKRLLAHGIRAQSAM